MSASLSERRLTICGLTELGSFQDAAVTHVLSILDPDYPEPPDFAAYGPHKRLTMRFDDIIEDTPGMQPPQRHHVEALLEFGTGLAAAERRSAQPPARALPRRHLALQRLHDHAARGSAPGDGRGRAVRAHPRDLPAGMAELTHDRLRRRSARARRQAFRSAAPALFRADAAAPRPRRHDRANRF